MKKIVSLLLAAVLCVCLLTAAVPASQGSTVYFMVVNEKLLDLERSTMPIMVNGTLYVPYTMFSIDATGVNLDVYATYSSVKNQVLVYSTSKQLIFDISSGDTYEPGGKTYSERAMVRNSTAYVPIGRVCDVFKGEISYTVSSTEYGRLIRLTNRSKVLTDAQYINAADNMLRSSLNRYREANPATPSGPSAPVQSLGSGAAVYLGFTLSEELSPAYMLDALERQDISALVFMTAEQLETEDDLVRELVGRGHFVGLRVEGTEEREVSAVLDELRLGQRLLTAAAHYKALVVLAEGADEAMTEAVEAAGYVCWQTTADGRALDGTAYSRAVELMKEMDGCEEARNCLLLDSRNGDMLASLLEFIYEEEYHFRAPVAPEL